VKALDTTVLARFFVDDPDDAQAVKQRPAAVAALSERGFVSVTVLLEFEWVMRGFYELSRPDIVRLLLALASIDHISVEDRRAVLAAIEASSRGSTSRTRCTSRAPHTPPPSLLSIAGWPSGHPDLVRLRRLNC